MSAALGVAASVASGLANGSWNLPTKPDAPAWAYAGRVWAWENIWLVANLMIPCFNTAVVLLVIGPETLRAIYDAATPAQMWSIVVPSLGWGWGGVGFGQAQDPIYIAEIAPPAHRVRKHHRVAQGERQDVRPARRH